MFRFFLPTFRRLAVSGSIIIRTSFTSWLTLGPTSEAPVRITMLFGDLFIDAAPFFEMPALRFSAWT